MISLLPNEIKEMLYKCSWGKTDSMKKNKIPGFEGL